MNGARAVLPLSAALFWGVAGLPLRAADDALARFQFQEPAMGTIFKIQLYASSREAARPAVEAAWKRVHQLNAIFSDYDPDSELMRFCREPVGTPVMLSPELHEILSHSLQLSERTDGAFDVTVGPLKRLWRQTRRDGRLPDPQRLEQARAASGYRNLKLQDDGSAILLVEGMRLDLGGIAKGYAADEALRLLRTLGFSRALVAASGDIAVGDAPPGKAGWEIGITSLASPDEPDETLVLQNAAVSTSGDTMQYVVIDGKRYSHILSPHTGLGLEVRRSASVVATRARDSDSLATTACILGFAFDREPSFPQFREARIHELQPDGSVRFSTVGPR